MICALDEYCDMEGCTLCEGSDTVKEMEKQGQEVDEEKLYELVRCVEC